MVAIARILDSRDQVRARCLGATATLAALDQLEGSADMQRQRPLGITILGILAIIGGVLGFFGSLAIIFAGSVVATAGAATSTATTGAFYTFLGIVFLVFSIGDVVLGIGFLTLKQWAWTLGVGLQILGIVIDILFITQGNSAGSEVINILLSAVIIYYLFRPEVKAAFGRA